MTQVASIRTRAENAVSEIPISSVELDSDYLWWKFHGQGTGANTVADEGTGIFNEITIANNTPLDWTTAPGWLSLATATNANEYIETDPDTAEMDFLRVDNMTEGALIISAQVQMPDATSGISTYCSLGNEGGTVEGSWAFQLNSARKVTNALIGAGATRYQKVGTIALSLETIYTIGMIIDVSNLTVYGYVNGIEDSSNVFVKPTIAPSVNRFGLLTSSNAGSGANEPGESDTITTFKHLVRDLIVVRVATDKSSQFNEIMSGFYNYPTEIPYALNGV